MSINLVYFWRSQGTKRRLFVLWKQS